MMARIFLGLASNAISNLMIKLMGLVVMVWAARKLPVDDYGQFVAIVSGLVLFGNTVANALIPSCSVMLRHGSKFRFRRVICFTTFFLFFALYFLVYSSVKFLIDFLGGDGVPNSLFLLPLILFSVFYSYRNGVGRFGLTVGLVLLSVILFVACYGVLELSGVVYEVDVFIFLYVLPYVFLSIGFFLVDRPVFSLLLLKRWKRYFFLRVSLIVSAVSAAGVVPFFTWFFYQLLIANDSARELAFFASAMQWSVIFSQLAIVVGGVLVSRLKDKAIHFINDFIVWLPVQFCAAVVCFFPEIHFFVFGDQYRNEEMKIILMLVMVNASFNAMKSSIGRNILSKGFSSLSIVTNTLWGGLVFIFISYSKDYTAVSLAVAYLICNLIVFLAFFKRYVSLEVLSRYLFFSKTGFGSTLFLFVIPFVVFLDVSYAIRFALLVIYSLILGYILMKEIRENYVV